MKLRNERDGPRAKLEKIELDLSTYKILLNFQDHKDPLVIHFDTPSRRFYFSLIALVVSETKNLGKPGFIHIRKHEKTLRQLDNSLAGRYTSKTAYGMWDKIRRAWHYILPDLEKAAHFKILGRDLIAPQEKGGKYRYECSDEECDTWASLFDSDEKNKWRFKFAVDSASLSLDDISLTLGDARDNSAWQGFLKSLSPVEEPGPADAKEVKERTGWRRAAVAAVVILIIFAVGVAIRNLYFRPAPPPAELELPGKSSIAVLPFVNMSGDPEQEYFSDGITEELITTLSKLPSLFVISRNSTFTYKGKQLKVKQIGKELGVRYVLEGSIQKAGDRVRIAVQLVDARTDHHLWAETYDRQLKDIFALQDEIIMKIITELQVKLAMGDEARLRGKGTDSIKAYMKYLQGIYYRFQGTPEDNVRARKISEEAIRLDPEFSSAYALLSRTHLMDYRLRTTKSPEKSVEKAFELAQKAIALDETNADAYWVLSWTYRAKRNYEKAVEKAEYAVTLNPNNSLAVSLYGIELMFVGRFEEAIPEFKKAISLDPINPYAALWNLGETYRNMGRCEEALGYLKKAVQLQPKNFIIHLNLAACYSELGFEEKARAAASDVLKYNPEFSLRHWAEFVPYKDQAVIDRWIEALRKAGLPE
jgi:TolB-like protein/TolA-binding protein